MRRALIIALMLAFAARAQDAAPWWNALAADGAAATPEIIYNPSTDFTYTDAGDHIVINSYIGAAGQCNIPPTIDGKPVTALAWRALSGNAVITGVIFPSSIIAALDQVCYNSPNLTSVIVGDNVGVIGGYSFQACPKLGYVRLGAGVRELQDSCFSGCPITNLVWGGGETAIGGAAFGGNLLTSLSIPDSVVRIGAYAFMASTVLANVEIGSGCVVIGKQAFHNCPKLATVTLGNSLADVGPSGFGYGHYATVVIPASMTNLQASAFGGYSYLTRVYMMGNAPTAAGDAFATSATVYRRADATGYPDVPDAFGGVATALWTSYPDPMP